MEAERVGAPDEAPKVWDRNTSELERIRVDFEILSDTVSLIIACISD
jgi:hypothetical protein